MTLFTNIFEFFTEVIIKTFVQAFEALYNFLSFRIPIDGIINVVIKIITFFGGEAPKWLLQLQSEGLSILTIGGTAITLVLIAVVIKKLIPAA